MIRRPPRSNRTCTRFPDTTRVRSGTEEGLSFIQVGLHAWWASGTLEEATINGNLGFLLRDGDAVVSTVSFAYAEDGKLEDVFIMRNPDKLARIEAAPRIALQSPSPACGRRCRRRMRVAAKRASFAPARKRQIKRKHRYAPLPPKIGMAPCGEKGGTS